MPKNNKVLAAQKNHIKCFTFRNSPVKKPITPARISSAAKAPEVKPAYLKI